MLNNISQIDSFSHSASWKKIFKTIVAFLVTAAAPSIVFFAICLWQIISIGEFIYQIFWVFFFTAFAFLVAVIYIVLLGLPIFLLGWYLGLIRWWTTLPASFIIGALITAFAFLGGRPFDYIFPLATIMGVFGFCGGVTFWILWRYWVSPDSPHGRRKEIKDLVMVQDI
jgi:hypothetical protein